MYGGYVLMKAIQHEGQITTITSKGKDGSLRYSVSTQEINDPEMKLGLFALQNQHVQILINPFEGNEANEVLEFKSEVDQKTPSQRLRGCLYVLLEKKLGRKPEHSEWVDYYNKQMDALIEKVKAKFEDYE